MLDAKYRIEKLRERKEREIFLATIEMKERLQTTQELQAKPITNTILEFNKL